MKKPCIFFRNNGWCKFKGDCRFTHNKIGQEQLTGQEQHRSTGQEQHRLTGQTSDCDKGQKGGYRTTDYDRRHDFWGREQDNKRVRGHDYRRDRRQSSFDNRDTTRQFFGEDKGRQDYNNSHDRLIKLEQTMTRFENMLGNIINNNNIPFLGQRTQMSPNQDIWGQMREQASWQETETNDQ